MKTLKIILLLPVILFSFCSSKSGEKATDAINNQQAQQAFKVHGKITNYTGTQLVMFEYTPNQQQVTLDTATISADGSFTFEGFVREKTLAIISLAPYRNVFLVVDSTSNIELNIDNGKFVSYTVKGSTDAEELQKIASLNAEYNQKIIDIDAQNQQNPGMGQAGMEEANRKVEALIAELKTKVTETASASNSPFAQVIAIEVMQATPDLKVEKNILETVKKQPSNKWFDFYKSHAETRINTAIGATAPDISLNTPEGTQLKLSSLRGKYVLIDFWASWCRPCRAENPNVVRLYSQYKDKGFEIYGVSLDQQADAWKGAIAADNLTWKHVSDLMGWASSAAKLYNVSSIPQTILLDKQGKILAKGLRGPALEEKLKTLLN